MRKVLVTGASGLLGTEICKQLKESGKYVVWALDNHTRSDSIPPCDHWIKGDIRHDDTVKQLPLDLDYIYHYSAINGTTNFYERPNEVLTNNFISDVAVFEFAAKCANLKKVVYASTSEIVSDDPQCPTPELMDVNINDIHNPRWSYRIGKIASENYLANSKIPWVIIRYFNVYGPGSKAGHFVADQIAKISRGVFEIIGGDETRSFCYIEDAIAATIYCGERVGHQVVNVGNDTETQIDEACKIIAAYMGHESPQWAVTEGRPGSTKRRLPCIDKLRQLWPEYSPRGFADGMSKIAEVLKLQR
jgi:nucleoside-diphosphate-sugar epimerase